MSLDFLGLADYLELAWRKPEHRLFRRPVLSGFLCASTITYVLKI
jgi:hypothetical protein